jgi:predicted DsbA family dithiol-disulfide isomerase
MQIDVWSDYACPWCALGLARLGIALSDFEHGADVTVVHRSFELDRHAPAASPGTAEEAVARKYGMAPERVRAGHAQLTALGAEVGLTFDFERVRLGNTFDAHRLTQSARGTEWEAALVRRLFAAHFSEGLQLSDHEVLRSVARSIGLPGDLTEGVLGGTAYASDVRADEAAAAERDVTGVPYFLIDGAWPVPGAQDVETLRILLERAWSRIDH